MESVDADEIKKFYLTPLCVNSQQSCIFLQTYRMKIFCMWILTWSLQERLLINSLSDPAENHGGYMTEEFINSLFLQEDYTNENIKVIDLQNKSNKCLLVCSGNGLYFPNTFEEYAQKIRVKDRYEWENITKNKIIRSHFSKIIFIRDIYKQWYVTGINSKINNIEKLAEHLKNETHGYQTSITGVSAGGYIAVLIGILIEADTIITVCGQYNLWDFVDTNPLLKKYKNQPEYSKYYNIINLIKEKTNIIYFAPIYCENDTPQYELVKNHPNMKIFAFDGKTHGLGEICIINYPYLLTYDKRKIDRLYMKYKDKIINPYLFYIEKKIIFLRIFYFFIRRIIKLKKIIARNTWLLGKG
jgi:hypothetical protein